MDTASILIFIGVLAIFLVLVSTGLYGKMLSKQWGFIVRIALKDPKTRAALYDAMKEEAARRNPDKSHSERL
jgi:hypothetical protein